MPTDRGWSSSPTDVLFHRVINWLNAHPEDGPAYRTDVVARGLGVEASAVGESFDLMDTIGWGDAKHYLGGGAWAQLLFVKSRGSAYLREYQERTRARSAQINACTDALLDWLYEHDGENVTTAQFSEDARSHYLGEPFDAGLVREAARSLLEQDLAAGTEMLSGHIIGLAIRPNGRDVVDAFESDVRAWRTRTLTGRQGDVNVRVDGSNAVTVAVHSPGASQTNTIKTTDRGAQIIGLADAFEQMLPVLGLTADGAAQTQTLIGELRELGGASDPEPGRVRRLFDSAKTLALAGTGNAAGTGLVALVEQIAENWPG